MAPVRPIVKPALRRLWRDATTLQLGLDPGHAVVIGGLDESSARLVSSLDGTRNVPAVLAAAEGLGVEPARASQLLDLLGRSGVLDDGEVDPTLLAGLTDYDRARLGPDLAAASLVHAGADGGAGVLARRRAAVVGVLGAGRVGAAVTTLLAAAGVGALVVQDRETARAADVGPAGLGRDDLGARRDDAALRAAHRVAPEVRRRSPARRTDLTFVCTPGSHAELSDPLVRSGVPHLYAEVREGVGLVGPLVLPGRSSCRRCHDLRRADRDPAWPGIAAQLGDPDRQWPSPCDVVLATAVAAHAVLQAFAFLDGDGTDLPPTVDGTLEIAQSDGRVRRRSWTAHPSCGCGWARSDG